MQGVWWCQADRHGSTRRWKESAEIEKERKRAQRPAFILLCLKLCYCLIAIIEQKCFRTAAIQVVLNCDENKSKVLFASSAIRFTHGQSAHEAYFAIGQSDKKVCHSSGFIGSRRTLHSCSRPWDTTCTSWVIGLTIINSRQARQKLNLQFSKVGADYLLTFCVSRL